MLAVDDAKMRAIVPAPAAGNRGAVFIWSPGSHRGDLGARLRRGSAPPVLGRGCGRQDPCNLVYAVWRFEPTPEVVVQVKSNPGEHESSACGAYGYVTVRRTQVSPVEALGGRGVPAPAFGGERSRQRRCRCSVDGATASAG